MRTGSSVAVVTVLLAGCLPSLAAAKSLSLGQVQFTNTCKPSVQSSFLTGVALLHSMEFKQAEQSFRDTEAGDPNCSMAAWGVALAETERAGANAPQKALAAGWNQLQPWLQKPAESKRERMYLGAISAMYKGYAKTPGAVRWSRYLARMNTLRRAYPNDVNASLFYALGLVWTAGSGQSGLTQRRKALDILLPIFQKFPNNPGAAHDIIHAADTPELALIALTAARKYAAIAPDSPHALHMPSHIFNRLGYWQASIESNTASARAAEQWIASGRGGAFDEAHALNNLEYAYLQLGEYNRARLVMDRIGKLAAQPGGDAWLPIDARIYFDADAHDWKDGLKIQPPAKSPFDENFDVYWIHVIAAARSGEPASASASLAQFRKSASEWIPAHGFGDALHLALLEAESWARFSQGHKDEAIKELKTAMHFEKDHPIYYADTLARPAAEMLGDMLLDMGERDEAAAAYAAALTVAPNRYDSLAGLGRRPLPAG